MRGGVFCETTCSTNNKKEDINIKVAWDIERLDNGHLLLSTDRLINSPYYNTGLYEMDLLGKIYVEYSLEGGYHHDYYEMENGNLLIASDDFNNDFLFNYWTRSKNGII